MLSLFIKDDSLSNLENAMALAIEMGFETEKEFDSFVRETTFQWNMDEVNALPF